MNVIPHRIDRHALIHYHATVAETDHCRRAAADLRARWAREMPEAPPHDDEPSDRPQTT